MFIHVGYEFNVTQQSIGMIQDFGLWILYGINIDSSRINSSVHWDFSWGPIFRQFKDLHSHGFKVQGV